MVNNHCFNYPDRLAITFSLILLFSYTMTNFRNSSSNRGYGNRPFQQLDGYNARRYNSRNNLPDIMSIGIDGEDHINIYLDGKTELGKALSHSAKIEFIDSRNDKFSCVEAYWTWLKLKTPESNVRTMTGIQLRNYAGRNPDNLLSVVPNFKYFIALANLQKVNQHEEILNAMRESTLPFDLYYVRHNKESGNFLPERPASASWLVPIMEAIRLHVKGDYQDRYFESLIDDPEHLAALDARQKKFNELYNGSSNTESSEVPVNQSVEEQTN